MRDSDNVLAYPGSRGQVHEFADPARYCRPRLAARRCMISRIGKVSFGERRMLLRYRAERLSVPAAEIDLSQFRRVGQPFPALRYRVGGLARAGKIGRNHHRPFGKKARQATQLRHVRQIGRDVGPACQHVGVGRPVTNPPPCRFHIQAGRRPFRTAGMPAMTATASPDAAAIF